MGPRALLRRRHHQHLVPEARAPDRRIPGRRRNQRRPARRVRELGHHPVGSHAGDHHPGRGQPDVVPQPRHPLSGLQRMRLRPGSRRNLRRQVGSARRRHSCHLPVLAGKPGLRHPGRPPPAGCRNAVGDGHSGIGSPVAGLRRRNQRLHLLRRRLIGRWRLDVPRRQQTRVSGYRKRNRFGHRCLGEWLVHLEHHQPGKYHQHQPGRLHLGRLPDVCGRRRQPVGWRGSHHIGRAEVSFPGFGSGWSVRSHQCRVSVGQRVLRHRSRHHRPGSSGGSRRPRFRIRRLVHLEPAVARLHHHQLDCLSHHHHLPGYRRFRRIHASR